MIPDSILAVMTIVFVWWKPRGERLNPALVLQRNTRLTAGVMETFFNTTMLGLTRQRCRNNCLDTVTTFHLPALFPDLSSIVHTWKHLERRVGNPTILNQLVTRLQQLRNEMSQDIKQNFCPSMPDRISSCIRARGG
ncbi:transposable element Tcb1 transposase [Trichonephila clavipes]|nr:transposable element Tcb1 transposase [Trichonephila clavipes]